MVLTLTWDQALFCLLLCSFGLRGKKKQLTEITGEGMIAGYLNVKS